MITLDDPQFFIEEEEPPLDIAMPQVYRRPAQPPPPGGLPRVRELVRQAVAATAAGNGPAFGLAYGELVVRFKPTIHWAISCWEYLLTTQGIRFLSRTPEERRYSRGNYKVVLEKDFDSLAHRVFKSMLLSFHGTGDFGPHIKRNFWPALLSAYQKLEQPEDGRERKLTPYSYLRCSPYQFLNEFHHHRVMQAVSRLPKPKKQVVDLYYLRFYTEEAVIDAEGINAAAFRRRQKGALREIERKDRLSAILLNQIERY